MKKGVYKALLSKIPNGTGNILLLQGRIPTKIVQKKNLKVYNTNSHERAGKIWPEGRGTARKGRENLV